MEMYIYMNLIFFLKKAYKFLNIHRIWGNFYTYEIVVTHGIQINHKKCKNVRFEENSISTGGWINSVKATE